VINKSRVTEAKFLDITAANGVSTATWCGRAPIDRLPESLDSQIQTAKPEI
jgi:hypothetical protein